MEKLISAGERTEHAVPDNALDVALPKIVLSAPEAVWTRGPLVITTGWQAYVPGVARTNFADLTATQKALWSTDLWRLARDHTFISRFSRAMQADGQLAPLLLIRPDCPYCGRCGPRDLFDNCYGCGGPPQVAATRRTLPQPAVMRLSP